MSGHIRLSPKHGVNPSLAICFFCQKDRGDIMLPGLLTGDTQAPMRAVWDYEPCEECKGHMTRGIILISVDESKSDDKNNPYRTGGWCVVSDDAIKRVFTAGPSLDAALKKRCCFLPDDVWSLLKLPKT